MHVIGKTVTSSNRACIGDHVGKKGVANFVESIRFVCSIVVFNIFCFIYCIGPEFFKSAVMQNMAVESGAQVFNREVIEIVIDN